MTISPNLGVIGAPQLGHFKDVTPEGARIGEEEGARIGEEEVTVGLAVFNPVLVPHLAQTAASSGI
jgi:hypothetical protein